MAELEGEPGGKCNSEGNSRFKARHRHREPPRVPQLCLEIRAQAHASLSQGRHHVNQAHTLPRAQTYGKGTCRQSPCLRPAVGTELAAGAPERGGAWNVDRARGHKSSLHPECIALGYFLSQVSPATRHQQPRAAFMPRATRQSSRSVCKLAGSQGNVT